MALKDKLMTLEDFKAVRDVDVASNSAQFTEIKADLADVNEHLLKDVVVGSSVVITNSPCSCRIQGPSNSLYDATTLIDGVNIKVTRLNGQTTTANKFLVSAGQIGKANGNIFVTDRLRSTSTDYAEYAIGRSGSSAVEISLLPTRCDYTIAAVNEYLHNNPIRIWYQTPNYASAERFCEYIICDGHENYTVIGTLDAIDPLGENDYIDIGRGAVIRDAVNGSVELSGGINDIPNDATLAGSGSIRVESLVDLTGVFESVVTKDGENEIIPKNTTFFDNINYFDESKALYVTNAFVDASGNIISSNIAKSIIIPVKPSTQYVLYIPDNNRGHVVGNDTNSFVVGNTYATLFTSGTSGTGYAFTTGVSHQYIFVYFYSGAYDYDTNKSGIRLVEGSTISPYSQPTIKRENLPQDIVPAVSPLDGANILIFGDSITSTCTFTINASNETTAYIWKNPSNSYVDGNGNTVQFSMWAKILKESEPCGEIRNYAMSGASYRTSTRDAGYERQNLQYQIDVAMNDLDNPNNVFEVDSYVPDIVIFALGTNDGIPADDYNSAMNATVTTDNVINVDATISALDDTKTIASARKAFMRIKKAFPLAQIYCVLPIQRADNDTNIGSLHDNLKQIAQRYGCIIIDGAFGSGITRDGNVMNALGVYLKDGLHPNEKGQNLMARMIISSLMAHYIPFGTGFNQIH